MIMGNPSFRSPLKESYTSSNEDNIARYNNASASNNGTDLPKDKLIPQKSPSFKKLPPISVSKRSVSSADAAPVSLAPGYDEDFEHSINSTPLSHKENVIPVKYVQSKNNENRNNNNSNININHDNDSITYSPPNSAAEKALNQAAMTMTPNINNNKTRNVSLSINNSPIPDLTPPPCSKPKIYDSILSTPVGNKSNSKGKRYFSTPLSASASASANSTPLLARHSVGLPRPSVPLSGGVGVSASGGGVRKVSSPGSSIFRKKSSTGLSRSMSSSLSSPLASSTKAAQQFKSPLKNPLNGYGSNSGSNLNTPIKVTKRQHSASLALHLKELSKQNKTAAGLLAVEKQLDAEIDDLTKKTTMLTSYKNLKLHDPKVPSKDAWLVDKWLSITKKLSQHLLEMYSEKILQKHESFRNYKLSKYDSFRKNLKWQLLNTMEDKYNEITESEEYEKLSDYEKSCIEKDYNHAKKTALDDFNRQCDLKFKEMFKEDIEQTRAISGSGAKEEGYGNYANNPNDIIDEYEMKDLYKDLKLDFELVYGKLNKR